MVLAAYRPQPCGRKKLPADLDVRGKIRFLKETWRKMRVSLERRLGHSLVFISVLELQSDGNPHLLVGSYLPKAWISSAWQALGGGWATRIEFADFHRVAAYLAKYLTEDSVSELPARTRRFSTSRGLALFDRSTGSDTWVLVEEPSNTRGNALLTSSRNLSKQTKRDTCLSLFHRK